MWQSMNPRALAGRRTRRMFGLAAVACLPALAAAAEPTDHLNVQEPTRPGYLGPPLADGFQLPPIAPATASPIAQPVAAPAQAVRIHRIVFQGNAAISTDELNGLVANYLDRDLDDADLEELRLQISRHYVDRGFVNSGALLGDSPVSGHELTVRVVEGHLTAIRLRGMERLADDYVVKRLARDPEAVFNMDQLRERFQLLLDDPLFKRMNARLLPGDRLGEAVLDVDVVRAVPYQLSVFANNYRPPSIGEKVLGISGWLRNLTGYGDHLEFSVQRPAEEAHGTRTSLGWQMPLNAAGTQLTVQLAHGLSSVVEEPMRDLAIQSSLDSKELGLSQTLVETLNHKLSVGLTRLDRENQTTLAGTPFSFVAAEPTGLVKVSAARFWQEYSFRTERQVLTLRSTLTSAHNNLQSVSGLPVGATVPADQNYQVWLGQAQFARRVLDNGAQFIGRATLQQTADRLLPLDRMSIGGIYTVRGYRENELLRDKGRIFNFEFDYPLMRPSEQGIGLALIPFYDIGSGQNQDEPADTLSSAGLAIRLQWRGMRLDGVLAKRLRHPGNVTHSSGSLQDRAVHVQLAYDFF